MITIVIKQFDEILNNAIKNKKENDIQGLKQYIKLVYDVIKSLIYDNIDKINEMDQTMKKDQVAETTYKIERAMQEVLRDDLEKISYNIPTEDEANILNAYLHLLYNYKKRKDLYVKVKDQNIENLQKGSIGANIEKNEEQIIKQVLLLYREEREKITDQEYKVLEAYKQNQNVRKKAEKILSDKELEYVKQKSKLVGKEDEKFEETFQSTRNIFLENIREKYIISLIEIGKVIKKLGLFEKYESREERNLKNIGIDIAKEEINLDEYFRREYLKNIPIKNLIAMNAFWSNRLTKEIEDISKAIFVFQDLNLIEEFLNEGKKYEEFPFEKLTDKEIEEEIIKNKVLKNISQICINKLEEDIDERNQSSERVERIDMRPYVKMVCAEYQNEYYEYFKNRTKKASNILGDDLENKYLVGRNFTDNLYRCKNATDLALIESCIIQNDIQNWGYIEEQNEKNKNYVLLGFDIQGLNMPLRLHIPKKYLTNFLDSNKIQHIIPIYKGNEDFTKNGEILKTNILIPTSSKQNKLLDQIEIDEQKDIQKSRYIAHLKYLIDTKTDKFPKHLKKAKTIGKGKKQKIKYIIEKEYIDLDTKEKYFLDKEGKYIKKPSQEISI